MPYEIMKDGDQWCVIKEGGERVKCHASEDEAKAQMRALYTADDKARVDRKVALLKAINHAYAELDTLDEAGEVVIIEPDPDEDDTQEAEPVTVEEPAVEATEEVEPEPEQKGIRHMVMDAFKNFFGRDDVTSGFKSYGDHWLAAWSNNYKDRDGEFFPEKAIDDYIWRVDHGLVPLPELWDSHIPGTRSGQADMVFRIGRFAMAVGHYDDTPMGEAAKAYYNRRRNKQEGISHGFLFDSNKFEDRAYWQFNTFELSPLGEFSKAANVYATYEGIKSMPLTDDKKKRLATIFGEDQANEIIAQYEQKSKELDELNIEFKEFVNPTGDETEAVKEAADNADKTFTDLVPELMEGQSEAVTAALGALKAVKSLTDRLEAQDKEIAALRNELALAPRASQAAETETDDNSAKEALAEKAKEGEGFNPFPNGNNS